MEIQKRAKWEFSITCLVYQCWSEQEHKLQYLYECWHNCSVLNNSVVIWITVGWTWLKTLTVSPSIAPAQRVSNLLQLRQQGNWFPIPHCMNHQTNLYIMNSNSSCKNCNHYFYLEWSFCSWPMVKFGISNRRPIFFCNFCLGFCFYYLCVYQYVVKHCGWKQNKEKYWPKHKSSWDKTIG